MADHVGKIVDLSDLTIEDLLTSENQALIECLRHVLEDADDPRDIVAGFQSAI